MRQRLTITLALLALVAAACGGDDAGSGTTAAGSGTTAAGSGDGAGCSTVFTLDEVAALFGEPAMFDAESSSEEPDAGTLDCVWSSVESEDDLEDLQVHLFQIQVYQGVEYYAPDFQFEDWEPVPGIGDEAFVSPQLGVSAGFKDGSLVAFLTYSVIGPGDAPDSFTKKDQVVDLLRVVHDRLT